MSLTATEAVDKYYSDLLKVEDAVLSGVLESARAAGLPAIHVSALQGRQLMLLAKVMGAKRILEVGTLAGYSTIWLARGMAAGGKIVTLEAMEHHAAVARESFRRARIESSVELHVGLALETLPKVAEQNTAAPFDLIFLDADKVNYPGYLDWAVKLSKPGTLIVADNVVRGGAVVDATSVDENVRGVREFGRKVAANPKLQATVIQTVGAKGYDGYMMIVVN